MVLWRRETNGDDGPRPNNGEPEPVSGWRRGFLRLFSPLFLLVGVVCLGFPLVLTFLPDGPGLAPDTLAYFGVGSDENVPVVTAVSCVRTTTGTTRYRSVRYECRLDLGGALLPAASRDGLKQVATTLAASVPIPGPSSFERELADDRTGDLPTLRRLWGEGIDGVYGAVWSGGELAGRWLRWALDAALFWVFGVMCIVAAVIGWRRTRRRPSLA